MAREQAVAGGSEFTAAEAAAVGQVAGEGRVRYAPVIGSGPMPVGGKASAGRPLVKDPDAWQHTTRSEASRIGASQGGTGAEASRIGASQGGTGAEVSRTGTSQGGTGAEAPGKDGMGPEARGWGADRGAGLTVSGHEVAEFVAGSAHMVQMVAGEFPLGTVPEQGLGEVVGAAHALVAAAQSLLVSATHEAVVRGLPAESGHSVPDWITTWAPRVDRAEALATARVAANLDDARLEGLAAKVRDGSARVSRANVITKMALDLASIATADSLQAVTDLMTGIVEETGVSELSTIASRTKAQLVEPDEDEQADDEKGCRRLLRRVGTVAGLAEWQLLLDEEGQAILSAALDPLSAPRPGADEHGAHRLDHRTAATRRADALLEIIGRGVAAPEGTTVTEKAKIQVTVNAEALAGKLPGGGHTGTGQRLSAGTIRRLACDAQIIPVVLGGPSEALDVGVTKRLFTPAQRTAVLLRDQGCSFPGCSAPAGWTEIHHIVHWVFGGATDLSNAAALCRRHHVIVHRYGYTATVTATGVIWHLPEGQGIPTGSQVDP